MNRTPTKTFLGCFAITAILLISACTKKDGDTTVNNQVKTAVEIKTSTAFISMRRETFSYNQQLLSMFTRVDSQSNGNVSSGHEAYAYYRDSVVGTGSNTFGDWTMVYNLNAAGYYIRNGNDIYDSDNRIIERKIYPYGFLGVQITYSGGNAVQSKELYKDTVRSITDYTYYTDKTENRDYGLTWLNGKGSINLLKNSTNQSLTTGYTYEFDSQGRVIKETAHSYNGSSTGITTVKTFTYVQ